jgi:hypothetical protein
LWTGVEPLYTYLFSDPLLFFGRLLGPVKEKEMAIGLGIDDPGSAP